MTTSTNPASPADLDADTGLDEGLIATDTAKRVCFYLRPPSQGGRWMACDFVTGDDGTVEKVRLRGRTNPKAEMLVDEYLWDSRRAGQVVSWLEKRMEKGNYSTFGGPIEAFAELSLEQMRAAWRADCGEEDPDLFAKFSEIMDEADARTIAEAVTRLRFTIDFTTATFGQRVAAGAKFTRPNGETYYARQLGDSTDVEFLRNARAAQMTVLFRGAPGCGKTALVEAAFPDCISIDGTGETEVADFIGGYNPGATQGTYEWVDGPLIRAMLQGVPLFVDELSRINPQVLTIIYPGMDGRGRIKAPGRPASAGGVDVQAAPGFYIIAAYNPDIPGCRIDEPLMSRFGMHVELDTCYTLAKVIGVPLNAIDAAKSLEAQRRDPQYDLDWAPQLRELIRFKTTAETFSEDIAWQNLVSGAPAHARPLVAAACKTASGKVVPVLQLGETITGSAAAALATKKS